MLGEDAGAFRSDPKMEKMNSKNFDSSILKENHLESMEKRLRSSGIFSQDYFIGDPLEHPERSARSKH